MRRDPHNTGTCINVLYASFATIASFAITLVMIGA